MTRLVGHWVPVGPCPHCPSPGIIGTSHHGGILLRFSHLQGKPWINILNRITGGSSPSDQGKEYFHVFSFQNCGTLQNPLPCIFFSFKWHYEIVVMKLY